MIPCDKTVAKALPRIPIFNPKMNIGFNISYILDILNISHDEYINLELKSLSNITNEDAEKLQYTLVNVVGLDGLIRQNSIELVKEVVSNYEQIDCLFMLPSSFSDLARELGYAIDWNNHKVSKQIELGWVQLL